MNDSKSKQDMSIHRNTFAYFMELMCERWTKSNQITIDFIHKQTQEYFTTIYGALFSYYFVNNWFMVILPIYFYV